jgi:arylsulfatase
MQVLQLTQIMKSGVLFQPGVFSVDDLADVGMDQGTWVADYGISDVFNGKIHKVTINTKM